MRSDMPLFCLRDDRYVPLAIVPLQWISEAKDQDPDFYEAEIWFGEYHLFRTEGKKGEWIAELWDGPMKMGSDVEIGSAMSLDGIKKRCEQHYRSLIMSCLLPADNATD